MCSLSQLNIMKLFRCAVFIWRVSFNHKPKSMWRGIIVKSFIKTFGFQKAVSLLLEMSIYLFYHLLHFVIIVNKVESLQHLEKYFQKCFVLSFLRTLFSKSRSYAPYPPYNKYSDTLFACSLSCENNISHKIFFLLLIVGLQ